MMTPQELGDFMYTHGGFLSFEDKYHFEWVIEDSTEEERELSRKKLKEIGEVEDVEIRQDGDGYKHQTEIRTLHFRTLGFYMEERTHFVWGEKRDSEYYLLEKLDDGTLGNPKKLQLRD